MSTINTIIDPANEPSDQTKITARMDKVVYDYFFNHIFFCDRGVKQALINQFFQKLHAECIKRNIPGEWDPKNYASVSAVLADLTFDKPKAKAKPKPARKTK